jgi:outer membrane biosynthesis protein TonB
MAYFLEAQETASRFGDYIEEFRAILASNNIKFGSPDNFFAFARRLQSDDLLPGDLSRMVKSIFERESDKVSLRTILTIIAIAVGGSAVAESDRDLSKPMNLVLDFLIRSVNCSSVDPEHIDNMTIAPFTTATDLDEKGASRETVSPSPIELSTRDRPIGHFDTLAVPWASEFAHVSHRRHGRGQVDTSVAPGASSRSDSSTDDAPLQPLDGSTELIQSLTRLELNALESKHYLDSIEQRISRMEPRLENVPSQVSPAQNQSPAPDTKPLHRADPRVKPPSISGDFPLSSFVRRAFTQSKDHMAWFFLLGEKLAVPPVLAALAVGTLLYIGYQRNSAKTEIRPAVPAPAATTNPTPPTIDLASAAPPTDTPTDPTTEVADKPLPPKPSSSGFPSVNALDSKTTKHHSGRTPKPIEPPADHAVRSVQPANVEATESSEAQDSTETVPKARRDVGYTLAHASARSAPFSPRMVDVSSGVMAANLVSASPPSYPKLADLTHMQGKVIMQAIISKDGTVQNLHVIQGHRLLRGAAKNAVRTWRYHPYLVNGKPVEVATIVSVDFTLSR